MPETVSVLRVSELRRMILDYKETMWSTGNPYPFVIYFLFIIWYHILSYHIVWWGVVSRRVVSYHISIYRELSSVNIIDKRRSIFCVITPCSLAEVQWCCERRQYFHVVKWLHTGFGLVIGFTGPLKLVATRNYGSFTSLHT
jgi:hypothetical protein